MGNWTDSNSEKENCDDFKPPKKHQKPELPSSVKGKQCYTEMVEVLIGAEILSQSLLYAGAH